MLERFLFIGFLRFLMLALLFDTGFLCSCFFFDVLLLSVGQLSKFLDSVSQLLNGLFSFGQLIFK